MAKTHTQRRATFFWQGVLILLPVALMAVFSFWTILRERNAVEQEARGRAQEILRALPDEFGRMVANRLTYFEGAKNGWYNYLQWGLSPWPENKDRKQWLADTNESQIISNNLVALRSVFPEWQTGPVPLINFWFDTNGELLGIRKSPLHPPLWLESMSTEQLQAWETLQLTAFATESPSNLSEFCEAFQQTQPPLAAITCAEFIVLRAELPALSATNAIDKLFQFVRRNPDVITESGLPLSTLATAEILKYSKGIGPNKQLWDMLQGEVASPNTLTPILLNEAARLAAKDALLSESVQAMQTVVGDKQNQLELAEAVKKTGRIQGFTTANLWVNALDRRWFCILCPGEYRDGATISNRNESTTITNCAVQCYPQWLVVRSFADAFEDTKISLPDYFGISVALEGEPIFLPAPWGGLGNGKTNGDILAATNLQMWHPSILKKDDPNGGPQKEVTFEAMPGHPRFSVRIHLTDRDLLYAKQRRLQIILGSLIAAAALAAFTGFVTARGAFRRQQQISEMKSNFVSSVSHELRAPIASVRLLAENLERGKVTEPAKQGEYFHFIVQECQRLSSLIENILDFSRIEQGRKQYEFETTDLAALAAQTVTLMEPSTRDCGVRLETVLPEKIVSAEVDSRAIQQALVNLINNAAKHSAKGGSVEVGLDYRPDSFAFWVEDHGNGIPPEEHGKIFERFYRCGSELRRETQGVGIGLSIVKHIVEAHGGQVKVRSAVGQGSRFTLEIPIPTAITIR